MEECRAPFPPHLLQGKHFTCPPGWDQGQLNLCTAGDSTGEQCPSRHRFGLIRLVLIQLQKFGKHFVNTPRPGRAML